MTNYSRTTLRELKKRYLNILKKCLLANLMAFGMVTLSTPAASEDRLENYYDDKTYTSAVTFEELEMAIFNEGTITFGGEATFINNSASEGGAIYNLGDITFGGDATFTGNSAYSYGGAILNDGTITFGGEATFTNNSASQYGGGAIYNFGDITFGVGSTATFSDNTSTSDYIQGGAIYNYGTITFGKNSTATFTGNSATGYYGGAEAIAGAIYNLGDITFGENSTATFTNNSATDSYPYGGAIYNYDSTITFGKNSTATFTNNSASGDCALGGAIFNDYDSTITFGGDATFTGNSATSDYDAQGGAILNGGTITFGGDATFTNNSASYDGGAIWNSGYMLLEGENTFGGYQTDEKGEYVLDSEGNKISLGNQAKRGGAIYNTGGKKEGNVIAYGMTLGKSTFMGNTALSSGGAIWNSGYMNFTDDALFEGNESTSETGNAEGGAIFNMGGIKFAEQVTFGGDGENLGNHSINGAGVRNHGTIHFNSATFKNNVASNFGGGISNILGAKAVFEGTAVFENNKAYQGAGLSNAGEMTFDKLAVFQGNQVTNFGGGVWNYIDGNIVFKNTARFVQNTAQTGGGGVYNQENISFTSADFIGNKSLSSEGESYGGAISNVKYQKEEGTYIHATTSINGPSLFQDNIAQGATRAYGGAIYNYDTITFGGLATFEGNTSSATGGHSYGGAIRNDGGSVVFKDTDNNAEMPAVPNIAYGMTFNGNTLFTGNKAESETGNTQGGAIYNSGYMLLAGENTFGGYLQNTEDADGDGDKTEYVLDSEVNKISLGNQAKEGGAIYNTGGKKEGDVIAYGMTLGKSIFMGNTALSYGGAIFNSGYMNFTDEALFEGNSATATGGHSYGGAIRNNGANAVMTFKGNTLFTDNKSESKTDSGQGGAIYNSRGTITFGGEATFTNNSASSHGGAIYNYALSSKITFNGDASFTGNSASSHAGAIYNDGTITFGGEATFTGNSASSAGAIYNYSNAIINFNNSFTFTGNKTISKGVEIPNDIYNNSGTINFNHGYAEDGVTPLIGSLDGGIINNGIINKTGAGTLILGDEMVKSGTGTFNQSAGLTIAHTEHFLTGTNNITGGELRVHGSNMSNLKVTVGENALLTFLSTSTSEIEIGENVSVAGDVKFGADESVGTAKYHLNEDVRAKTITIQDSILTTENETFEGAYIMGENVTLDMQDGDMGDPVSFTNLTGSANLKIDADIVNGENGLKLVTDQIVTNQGATFKLALTDVVLSKNALDNGLSDSYTAPVMKGGTLTYGSEKGLVATDVYSYEVSGANNQITIDAMKFNEGSDVMKSVAEFDGDAAFNMTIGGDSYEMQSDVVMTKNTKSIIGKDKETSTLTAKKITVDGAILNVENVSVSGENQLIDVTSGTLNITTAKVDNIKNAGTLMLDTAEVSELENSGTLTANGSEIGDLVNGNKAEVTGGKVAKVTNKGTMTANGSEIGELVNEKDAEVTGGELETVTNKEKGMLSLSAGLRAGTVTNEGELTLDAVTVADLTNSATLKTNGSTVQKLVNEQEAELTASTVEDLTNTGKMTTKDLTLKGALKGEGRATLSGKLVADDIFKSENKIISDGMEVSENIQKMELADLEIKSGTTLDIGTREVTAKEVKVGDKATLQVTLNDLDEHGTMKADKIEAGAGAGVHLVLGEKFEGGVFDVFKGTKGAGDLEVKHNNLYNVVEVEEGKYSFMTKDTEALQESLGATKEEVSVADAMTKGTSTNEAFNKVQSEVLIALQSLETDTVAKAKKALSAVGSKEHPVEQSVASEHLVALQNVVQAELHGTTVGHSGGDTDPRAKVYIKGLYDRTKSSMGEGFRARSKGAVLGVQSEVTDTLTLGVGYATSQTTAKEDLRRTEVDTNTGFVSAHYQPNAWWVSGLATFSRGEYEEEKQILSSTGKASYDVDSWGAQVMTGYDIKLENAIITPEVGMRYLSVKQEGYTDTLGTTVAGTRSDYLTALVGVKGTWDMGAIRPSAGVTVGYDVISDDVSALNTLANGASYTVNGEALDRLSTGVSLGVEADIGERTTLKLEYSGTFRKEYSDHSGMLKFELRF